MDYASDIDTHNDTAAIETADAENEAKASPQDKQLVAQILRTIKDDKKHHESAFKRMRRDMQVAMWGAEKDWGEDRYRANIAGRHVKQKTAALYAKNPRAVARRRETIDFAVWDEDPSSLELAMQTLQMGMQALQAAQMAAPQADPLTGMIMPAAPPQLPPGFEQAQATIADFQQGMQRRTMIDKIGKTLEILFAQAMREQKPIDFKRAMKKVVRRACTTGVGYVKLGFQREYGPRPGMTEKLADARARLDHMRRLAEELAEGEFDEDAAERAELEHSVQSLMGEAEILLREGLIFDFPQSTKVIPDKATKSLDGFVGARHLTVEYVYTVDEVKEIFQKDVGSAYTSYTTNAGSSRDISANDVLDDDYEWSPPDKKNNGMVCVWEYFDKLSGLVYYVADGYPDFLRPPAAPDVFVEDFWPIYALTFNDVESETELFPPSDVSLMLDMQKEHNRSRQGKREHRDAARPRWVFANGSFGDEDDPMMIQNLKPFQAVGLNMDPTSDIKRILQTLPVPGVDPNLYDTNEVFTDTQMVVGTQEAQFGGVAKATATESAIAANATTSSDGSAIDDLDSFLSTIARSSSQIMLREYSAEKVTEIAGPGAVWPEMTLADIANELFLEVEAGSTGKPNQAVEINNWKQMLPLMMQIPNVNPIWLLKETVRRLDDRLDITAAIAAGIPAIVAMNAQQQLAPTAQPGNEPVAQGAEGAANAPQPPGGEGGTGPAFGSNQVDAPI
ncbi:hypothetical protein [Agrobacterium pusense]|uniref:hypothetical protein n=1 Tax=Agrobacterium pusense TaxID=648995 RepID=UPI0038515F48